MQNSHSYIQMEGIQHIQSPHRTTGNQAEAVGSSMIIQQRSYKWTLRTTVFTLFLLAGKSIGLLLSRFYFNNGGDSSWIISLTQVCGFPLLFIPIFFNKYFQESNKSQSINNGDCKTVNRRFPVWALIQIALGIFLGFGTFFNSIGLYFLHVSTYSLVFATQMAFIILFSFFLNSAKLTPLRLDSLVLPVISAIILLVGLTSEDRSSEDTNPQEDLTVGFIFTISASAIFSLWVSLMQLSFRVGPKNCTSLRVLKLIMCQYFVATIVCVVGSYLFKEWDDLSREMEWFKHGRKAYVMTLVGAALAWQISSIGLVGLIYEASSLLSNVVCTFDVLPVPILAVIFFGDRMQGLKVMALLLVLWGFICNVYQHYIDDSGSNYFQIRLRKCHLVRENVNRSVEEATM